MSEAEGGFENWKKSDDYTDKLSSREMELQRRVDQTPEEFVAERKEKLKETLGKMGEAFQYQADVLRGTHQRRAKSADEERAARLAIKKDIDTLRTQQAIENQRRKDNEETEFDSNESYSTDDEGNAFIPSHVEGYKK